MFCVYVTTDPLTDKFYIGKSSVHKVEAGYQGSGTWPLRAKAAGNKLITTIIETFDDEDDAYTFELLMVDMHLNDSNCMNFMRGGDGPSAKFVEAFYTTEMRQHHSALIRSSVTPANRLARSVGAKEWHGENKEKFRAIMRAVVSTDHIKALRNGNAKYYAKNAKDHGVISQLSVSKDGALRRNAASKAYHNNPVTKEKHRIASSVSRTPEKNAARSIAVAKYFANPENREKCRQASIAYWASRKAAKEQACKVM